MLVFQKFSVYSKSDLEHAWAQNSFHLKLRELNVAIPIIGCYRHHPCIQWNEISTNLWDRKCCDRQARPAAPTRRSNRYPAWHLEADSWAVYIVFFSHTIWTLPQVVGTNPLPTYYQEPRASLTAWWCIIETKSFHVAKTSHWAKVSHWVKVSHWAKVSHWVKVSHWAQLSHWMLILGFLCWMGVGIAALVQLSSHVSIGCSCRMVFAVV